LGKDRFRPTVHTGGGWNPAEQHFSPMGGLLTHCIERYATERGPDGLITSRLTFDILGTVSMDAFEVQVDVVRPGRTIELLEAIATSGGRPVVRGRAWRLHRTDTSAVAGGQPERLPPPDDLERFDLSSMWPGGYIASLEMRPINGSEPGRTSAWIRTSVEPVADEPVGDLARFVTLLDTANGIAPRVPLGEWFYPNVDLSVHLYRQPSAEWVGLDTTVVFGSDGRGLTSSVVHDINGPVGRLEQMLTLRRAS
jgi:hypothetical protein